MKVAKVNVTGDIANFEDIDITDIFLYPEKVNIISAVADKGNLYLIYTYNEEDFIIE